MERALQAIGVGGPLLVFAVVIGLGWVSVKAILQAWNAALAMMQRLITAAIDAHVREHHAGDKDFREEVRKGFKDIAEQLRTVHGRIDEYLAAEARAAKRRRDEDDARSTGTGGG